MNAISQDRVCEFFCDIEAANTVNEVWKKTREIADEAGASQVGIRQGLKSEKPQILWTIPDWVMEMYLETVFPDHDPRLQHCAQKTTPMIYGREFWSDDDELPEPRRIYDEEVVDVGMRSMVAVPTIARRGGEAGLFAWAFDMQQSEFRKMYDEAGLALHLISLAAYERVAVLNCSDQHDCVALSERERECILWLARGYRFGQIADKLGIKRVTVEFHVSNARKRLGVRSREQAVARAVTLGLLHP